MSLKEGTNLMELLGQTIWELVKYFGEMIWQTMVTIPTVAVLLLVSIVIELLFGKRIRNRRRTNWKPTDAQNWDY
jgi:ABC-type anion transport system duplicated permease subunit